MNFFILLIGIILGFSAAKFLAGKKAGGQGIMKSTILSAAGYKIHLHHWLVALVILISLMIIKYYNNFVYGFLIGLMVQGLTYKDFYKIIYRD